MPSSSLGNYFVSLQRLAPCLQHSFSCQARINSKGLVIVSMMMNDSTIATPLPYAIDALLVAIDPVPLKTVATSTNDGDYASSISINGDQIDEEESVRSVKSKPRSIFKKYWNKEESYAPSVQRSPSPRCISNMHASLGLPSDDDDDATTNYESSLKQVEVAPKRSRSYDNIPLSHGWWGGLFTASTPSLLVQPYFTGQYTRSAMSDSELYKSKPLKSALRRSRFSKEGQAEISSRHCPPVTFKPQVEVVRFEPPKEIWAHEGWSSWFTYKGNY
jgi:hypothetical protein